MSQRQRREGSTGSAARPPAAVLGPTADVARREAMTAAAAERRASQATLTREEAAARERLHELDARIESLLSSDPQEFVIRFIQTGGQ